MKTKLINSEINDNYGATLLRERGVKNIDDFLTPDKSYLQSPEDLKNIKYATAMYISTLSMENVRILIIVDADCDGFTSAAIMYQYTKKIRPNCQIDYWLHEGKQHGLQDHIDRLMDEDIHYDLIILPDSSSNDAHYHDMLQDINIPCLVLDHHLTDVRLSDNAIVVNNQLSPDYRNKELTGAGIIYQFCRYVDSRLETNHADNFIDLAALGVIGDMGSVLEMENRYIITQGLSNIQNDLFKCLLMKAAYSITGNADAPWSSLVKKLNPITVAFYVVPAINALIRVGSMEEKDLLFQAFIDGGQLVPCKKRGAKGTYERADVEAARICTNAKAHQNKILDEMLFSVENKIFKYDLLENKILFIRLDEEKFPSELNGLLAMKLAAKYKKPTIVARLNNEGHIKGSIRGVNNSPMPSFKDFLLQSHLFEYVQGHNNAAGCDILDRNLSEFHQYANAALHDVDFGENCYEINFQRPATYTDLKDIIFDIDQYSSTWGQGNNEPLIYVTHVPVQNKRVMGTNQDTIKFEYNGITYIKFHAKELINQLEQDPTISLIEVVGRMTINVWGNTKTPQILIDDYDVES